MRRRRRADACSRCWLIARRAAGAPRPRDSPDAGAGAQRTQAPPGPLQDSGTAPLAGGGTAPSPLAVRLDLAGDPVSVRFKKPPRSALLFDLDTGRVLWRREPTRVLPIASLTKMMTALVVVDRVKPGAKVRITNEALRYQGSGVGLLPRGKWIGVNTMLYGLMLPSGNDAAIALAQRAAGGSVKRFVRYMNEKAESLGLRLHALLDAERLRGQGQPLVRRRPGGDRARGAARAAAGADRPARARRSCRSRSRAGGCTSTTTTRCCARAIAARRGSRRATPTPRGAAWSRPRGAGRSSSASSCWTRPDPGKQAMQLLDRGFKASAAT